MSLFRKRPAQPQRDRPNTTEVREAFRAHYLHPDDLDFDDAPGQAFDRWLTDVKAEAWDEGYYHATNGKWGPPETGENPYREGASPS